MASRDLSPGLNAGPSGFAETPVEGAITPLMSGDGLDNDSAPASPGTLTVQGNWVYWGQDSIFRDNDGDEWLP